MRYKKLILLILPIIIFGCLKEEPNLPEVKLLEEQEFNLWKALAHLYLPEEYSLYKEAIKRAKNHLIEVRSKFFLLRDYTPVEKEFQEILRQGEELKKLLEQEKNKRALLVLQGINGLEERIHNLHKLIMSMNEALDIRTKITRAEIYISEGRILYENGMYIDSDERLNQAGQYLERAENEIKSILKRFRDFNQIKKWRKWANETIEESRKRPSILIIKFERRLILYKDGIPIKTYSIGLGKRGLSDKSMAKDYATPEGKYKIIGKNPKSKYFKSLLINYPNEEDIIEFRKAKKVGLLPKTAKIGGLIEIHGGGSNLITYGCISMNNNEIQELYDLVSIGTPVTIVGAIN